MTRIVPNALTSAMIFGTFPAAPTPAAAEGSWAIWNVGGTWWFTQDNLGGLHLTFTLTQNGSGLSGTAQYATVTAPNIVPKVSSTVGSANGSITGDTFKVTVNWSRSSVGVYEGHVGADGVIRGVTYDQIQPGSRSTWTSGQAFGCLVAAAPPASDAASSQKPSPDVIMHATAAARCAAYAESAVQQNDSNIISHCGFTGPRWDSNRANHENWCRVVDPALPVSETAARTAGLAACWQQAAAKPQLKKPDLPFKGAAKRFAPQIQNH
jgi:hypothetical protein